MTAACWELEGGAATALVPGHWNEIWNRHIGCAHRVPGAQVDGEDGPE